MRSCSFLILAACAASAPKPTPTNVTTTSDPVTLAVVMSGWEMWIGNDKDPRVDKDAPERTPGALDGVVAGFAKADLAHAVPGARATLITYKDKAEVRLPMGPIANLTPAAFGTQQDYHGTIGVELLKGLELAADQLEAAPPGHRYLIVLGDGNDTNAELAASELPKLAERFAKANVEVTAIVYRTQLSGERDALDKLTKHVTRAPTAAELERALTGALATVR